MNNYAKSYIGLRKKFCLLYTLKEKYYCESKLYANNIPYTTPLLHGFPVSCLDITARHRKTEK